MCIIIVTHIYILQICLENDINGNYLKKNIIRNKYTIEYTCTHKSFMYIHSDAFNSIPELSTSIKHLSLFINKITSLHNHQFESLINLETISLKHNLLTLITKQLFRYNIKLRSINLSHNHITIFNVCLSKLPDLILVFIHSNKLKTLNEYTFKYYISGNESYKHRLSVEHNYLSCNCSMYWMIVLGDKMQANITYDTSCTYNDDISNSTLNDTSLQCFMDPIKLETSKCEHFKIPDCTKGLYIILHYHLQTKINIFIYSKLKLKVI